MRRYVLAFLACLIAGAAYFAYPASAVPQLAASTVKVVNTKGHGSGVHIGGGYIITAAHVVGDEQSFTLNATVGAPRKADLLWVNKAYDIALLRTSAAGLGVSPLDCRFIPAGSPVTAMGNPAQVEFVTTYGKIAGAPRQYGPWKSVYVTDMTTVMGQSGGPAFDEAGNVIGITVGVMGAQIGLFPTLVGFGFVVPSESVCELMGRV